MVPQAPITHTRNCSGLWRWTTATTTSVPKRRAARLEPASRLSSGDRRNFHCWHCHKQQRWRKSPPTRPCVLGPASHGRAVPPGPGRSIPCPALPRAIGRECPQGTSDERVKVSGVPPHSCVRDRTPHRPAVTRSPRAGQPRPGHAHPPGESRDPKFCRGAVQCPPSSSSGDNLTGKVWAWGVGEGSPRHRTKHTGVRNEKAPVPEAPCLQVRARRRR